MANRLYIVVCRGRRDVLKHVRGYTAELNDSPVNDTLTATAPPNPIAYTNDGGAGWGRPAISAPIPALSNERLCAWGIRESQTTAGTRQAFVDKAAQFPNLIRWFAQQGTGSGAAFVESETTDEMWARVKTLLGWIDVALR